MKTPNDPSDDRAPTVEEAARRLRLFGSVEAAIREGRIVFGRSPAVGSWRDDLASRLKAPPFHGESLVGRYLAELEAFGREPSRLLRRLLRRRRRPRDRRRRRQVRRRRARVIRFAHPRRPRDETRTRRCTGQWRSAFGGLPLVPLDNGLS